MELIKTLNGYLEIRKMSYYLVMVKKVHRNLHDEEDHHASSGRLCDLISLGK